MATKEEMVQMISKGVARNKKSGKDPGQIKNRNPYPVTPSKSNAKKK